MHDKKELCEKIRSVHPDIGECGIDVDVEWDETKAWIVDLKKDEEALKTHLEPEDADGCMEGKTMCLPWTPDCPIEGQHRCIEC